MSNLEMAYASLHCHRLGHGILPGLSGALLASGFPAMPTTSESELLAAAQAGDRDAFGELLRVHQQRVYACAVRMLGHSGDVDDVVQDVFVRAWKAIGRFDGRSELSTWLYRICVNVCLNRFRSGRRRRTVVDIDLAISTLETQGDATDLGRRATDPHEQVELRRLYHRLGAALDALSPPLRTTVVLVLMQGLSHSESASILGCSEGTVAWRIHEARKKLRASMGEEDNAGQASLSGGAA